MLSTAESNTMSLTTRQEEPLIASVNDVAAAIVDPLPHRTTTYSPASVTHAPLLRGNLSIQEVKDAEKTLSAIDLCTLSPESLFAMTYLHYTATMQRAKDIATGEASTADNESAMAAMPRATGFFSRPTDSSALLPTPPDTEGAPSAEALQRFVLGMAAVSGVQNSTKPNPSEVFAFLLEELASLVNKQRSNKPSEPNAAAAQGTTQPSNASPSADNRSRSLARAGEDSRAEASTNINGGKAKGSTSKRHQYETFADSTFSFSSGTLGVAEQLVMSVLLTIGAPNGFGSMGSEPSTSLNSRLPPYLPPASSLIQLQSASYADITTVQLQAAIRSILGPRRGLGRSGIHTSSASSGPRAQRANSGLYHIRQAPRQHYNHQQFSGFSAAPVTHFSSSFISELLARLRASASPSSSLPVGNNVIAFVVVAVLTRRCLPEILELLTILEKIHGSRPKQVLLMSQPTGHNASGSVSNANSSLPNNAHQQNTTNMPVLSPPSPVLDPAVGSAVSAFTIRPYLADRAAAVATNATASLPSSLVIDGVCSDPTVLRIPLSEGAVLHAFCVSRDRRYVAMSTNEGIAVFDLHTHEYTHHPGSAFGRNGAGSINSSSRPQGNTSITEAPPTSLGGSILLPSTVQGGPLESGSPTSSSATVPGSARPPAPSSPSTVQHGVAAHPPAWGLQFNPDATELLLSSANCKSHIRYAVPSMEVINSYEVEESCYALYMESGIRCHQSLCPPSMVTTAVAESAEASMATVQGTTAGPLSAAPSHHNVPSSNAANNVVAVRRTSANPGGNTTDTNTNSSTNNSTADLDVVSNARNNTARAVRANSVSTHGGDNNDNVPDEFLHRLNSNRPDPSAIYDNIIGSPEGTSRSASRGRRAISTDGEAVVSGPNGRFELFESPLLPYGHLPQATCYCAAADTTSITTGTMAGILSNACVSLQTGVHRTPPIVAVDNLRIAAYIHEDFLGTIVSFENLTAADENIAIFVVNNVVHCTQGQMSCVATLPTLPGYPWRFICVSWEAGTFSVIVNGSLIPLLASRTSSSRTVSTKTLHLLACSGHVANVAVWRGPLRLSTLQALARYKRFSLSSYGNQGAEFDGLEAGSDGVIPIAHLPLDEGSGIWVKELVSMTAHVMLPSSGWDTHETLPDIIDNGRLQTSYAALKELLWPNRFSSLPDWESGGGATRSSDTLDSDENSMNEDDDDPLGFGLFGSHRRGNLENSPNNSFGGLVPILSATDQDTFTMPHYVRVPTSILQGSRLVHSKYQTILIAPLARPGTDMILYLTQHSNVIDHIAFAPHSADTMLYLDYNDRYCYTYQQRFVNFTCAKTRTVFRNAQELSHWMTIANRLGYSSTAADSAGPSGGDDVDVESSSGSTTTPTILRRGIPHPAVGDALGASAEDSHPPINTSASHPIAGEAGRLSIGTLIETVYSVLAIEAFEIERAPRHFTQVSPKSLRAVVDGLCRCSSRSPFVKVLALLRLAMVHFRVAAASSEREATAFAKQISPSCREIMNLFTTGPLFVAASALFRLCVKVSQSPSQKADILCCATDGQNRTIVVGYLSLASACEIVHCILPNDPFKIMRMLESLLRACCRESFCELDDADPHPKDDATITLAINAAMNASTSTPTRGHNHHIDPTGSPNPLSVPVSTGVHRTGSTADHSTAAGTNNNNNTNRARRAPVGAWNDPTDVSNSFLQGTGSRTEQRTGITQNMVWFIMALVSCAHQSNNKALIAEALRLVLKASRRIVLSNGWREALQRSALQTVLLPMLHMVSTTCPDVISGGMEDDLLALLREVDECTRGRANNASHGEPNSLGRTPRTNPLGYGDDLGSINVHDADLSMHNNPNAISSSSVCNSPFGTYGARPNITTSSLMNDLAGPLDGSINAIRSPRSQTQLPSSSGDSYGGGDGSSPPQVLRSPVVEVISTNGPAQSFHNRSNSTLSPPAGVAGSGKEVSFSCRQVIDVQPTSAVGEWRIALDCTKASAVSMTRDGAGELNILSVKANGSLVSRKLMAREPALKLPFGGTLFVTGTGAVSLTIVKQFRFACDGSWLTIVRDSLRRSVLAVASQLLSVPAAVDLPLVPLCRSGLSGEALRRRGVKLPVERAPQQASELSLDILHGRGEGKSLADEALTAMRSSITENMKPAFRSMLAMLVHCGLPTSAAEEELKLRWVSGEWAAKLQGEDKASSMRSLMELTEWIVGSVQGGGISYSPSEGHNGSVSARRTSAPDSVRRGSDPSKNNSLGDSSRRTSFNTRRNTKSLTTSDSMDHLRTLFTKEATARQLEDVLVRRTQQALDTSKGLSILASFLEFATDRDSVQAALRCLSIMPITANQHYLDQFVGCGISLEHSLRVSLHKVIARCLGCVRLESSLASMADSTKRLTATAADGNNILTLLGVLVRNWDATDCDMMCGWDPITSTIVIAPTNNSVESSTTVPSHQTSQRNTGNASATDASLATSGSRKSGSPTSPPRASVHALSAFHAVTRGLDVDVLRAESSLSFSHNLGAAESLKNVESIQIIDFLNALASDHRAAGTPGMPSRGSLGHDNSIGDGSFMEQNFSTLNGTNARLAVGSNSTPTESPSTALGVRDSTTSFSGLITSPSVDNAHLIAVSDFGSIGRVMPNGIRVALPKQHITITRADRGTMVERIAPLDDPAITDPVRLRAEDGWAQQHQLGMPRVYYYEVTLFDIVTRCGIGLVGCTSHSDARQTTVDVCDYDSTGSLTFLGEEPRVLPSFSVGDTVGCGFIPTTRKIFFTLNGHFLGFTEYRPSQQSQGTAVEPELLYPTIMRFTVSAGDVGGKLLLNFGTIPFHFDFRRLHPSINIGAVAVPSSQSGPTWYTVGHVAVSALHYLAAKASQLHEQRRGSATIVIRHIVKAANEEVRRLARAIMGSRSVSRTGTAPIGFASLNNSGMRILPDLIESQNEEDTVVAPKSLSPPDASATLYSAAEQAGSELKSSELDTESLISMLLAGMAILAKSFSVPSFAASSSIEDTETISNDIFETVSVLIKVRTERIRLATLRLLPIVLPLLTPTPSQAESLVIPVYEDARARDPLANIRFSPQWARCEPRNVALETSTNARMLTGAQRSIVIGNILPRYGTVSFSVRITRDRMTPGHSLKGGYFIGLSTSTLAPLSPTNNSQSWKLVKPPVVWALHDTSPQLTHAVNPTVKPNNFQRTFGSSDLVTVVVNRDRGTVSFYRNGDFLKELYDDLPNNIDISPFVQMYNEDASATIYPGEITPSLSAPGLLSAVAVDSLRAMISLAPFAHAVAQKLKSEMVVDPLPRVTLSVFGSLPDGRIQLYQRVGSDEARVVIREVHGSRMKFSIGETSYYDLTQNLRLPPSPTIRGPTLIDENSSTSGICSVVEQLTECLNKVALPLVSEAAVAALEAKHRQTILQDERDTRVALHSDDRIRAFRELCELSKGIEKPCLPITAPPGYAFSATLSHPGFVLPPAYCGRLATVPTGSQFTETPFIAIAEPCIPMTGKSTIRCQLIRGHHGQILGGGYYFGVCQSSLLRKRRDMNVNPPDLWAIHDMDDTFWRLKHIVADRKLPYANDPNCLLVSGDIIRLEIDREERTLTAFRQAANATDEVSLGVIFDNLPKNAELHPFVHLYNFDAVAILLPPSTRTVPIRATTQQQRLAPALTKPRSCDGCLSQHRETRLTSPNWYKCNECADYNLCANCFVLYVHNGHTFTQMDPSALLFSASPPSTFKLQQQVVLSDAPVEFLSSIACSIESKSFNNLAIAKADDAHALWGLSGSTPSFTVTVDPQSKPEPFPFNRPVFVGITTLDFAIRSSTEAIRNACLLNANESATSPGAGVGGQQSNVSGLTQVVSHCSDNRIRPKIDRVALKPFGFQRGSCITLSVDVASKVVTVYRDWTLLGYVALPSAFEPGTPLVGFVLFSSTGSRASVDIPLSETTHGTIASLPSRQLAIVDLPNGTSRVVSTANCRAMLRPYQIADQPASGLSTFVAMGNAIVPCTVTGLSQLDNAFATIQLNPMAPTFSAPVANLFTSDVPVDHDPLVITASSALSGGETQGATLGDGFVISRILLTLVTLMDNELLFDDVAKYIERLVPLVAQLASVPVSNDTPFSYLNDMRNAIALTTRLMRTDMFTKPLEPLIPDLHFDADRAGTSEGMLMAVMSGPLSGCIVRVTRAAFDGAASSENFATAKYFGVVVYGGESHAMTMPRNFVDTAVPSMVDDLHDADEQGKTNGEDQGQRSPSQPSTAFPSEYERASTYPAPLDGEVEIDLSHCIPCLQCGHQPWWNVRDGLAASFLEQAVRDNLPEEEQAKAHTIRVFLDGDWHGELLGDSSGTILSLSLAYVNDSVVGTATVTSDLRGTLSCQVRGRYNRYERRVNLQITYDPLVAPEDVKSAAALAGVPWDNSIGLEGMVALIRSSVAAPFPGSSSAAASPTGKTPAASPLGSNSAYAKLEWSLSGLMDAEGMKTQGSWRNNLGVRGTFNITSLRGISIAKHQSRAQKTVPPLGDLEEPPAPIEIPRSAGSTLHRLTVLLSRHLFVLFVARSPDSSHAMRYKREVIRYHAHPFTEKFIATQREHCREDYFTVLADAVALIKGPSSKPWDLPTLAKIITKSIKLQPDVATQVPSIYWDAVHSLVSAAHSCGSAYRSNIISTLIELVRLVPPTPTLIDVLGAIFSWVDKNTLNPLGRLQQKDVAAGIELVMSIPQQHNPLFTTLPLPVFHGLLEMASCLAARKQVPLAFDKIGQLREKFPEVQVRCPFGTLNDKELKVGKVMAQQKIKVGSKGRYYFEIVLPDKQMATFAVGWGTSAHQDIPSQHVGSDVHSFAFCGTHVLSKGFKEDYRLGVEGPALAGAVVGTLIDLNERQAAWSVNGNVGRLIPLPIKDYNDDTELCAFVSTGSCSGLRVNLAASEFVYSPDGYTDINGNTTRAQIQPFAADERSIAPAQDLKFYTRVSTYMTAKSKRDRQFPGSPTVLADSSLPAPDSALDTERDPSSSAAPRRPQVTFQTPEPEPDALLVTHQLNTITPGTLQAYVSHVRVIESCMITAYRYVDLDSEAAEGLLAKAFKLLRPVLGESFRKMLTDVPVLDKSTVMPTITIRSADTAAVGPRSTEAALQMSVLGQLHKHFLTLPNDKFFASTPMFRVNLFLSASSHAPQDVGGPYRQLWTQMTEEMMRHPDSCFPHTDLHRNPLFRFVNNSRRVCLVADNDRNSPSDLQMFQFFGKIIGHMSRAHTPLAMDVSAFVWKFLVEAPLTIKDYYADVDSVVEQSMADDDFFVSEMANDVIPGFGDALADIANGADVGLYTSAGINMWEGASTYGSTVTSTPLQSGETSEQQSLSSPSSALLSIGLTNPTAATSAAGYLGGSTSTSGSHGKRHSTFANSATTVDLPISKRREIAEHCLLHSMDAQLTSIQKGMWCTLPRRATRCMCWWDLESLVCGDADPTVEKMKRYITTILHATREQYFWRIVEEMTGEQRSSLLCFASGQKRLPLTKKIRVAENAESLGHLPRAQSCSSLIIMPMYTSYESMKQKLMAAIAHSGEMELA